MKVAFHWIAANVIRDGTHHIMKVWLKTQDGEPWVKSVFEFDRSLSNYNTRIQVKCRLKYFMVVLLEAGSMHQS